MDAHEHNESEQILLTIAFSVVIGVILSLLYFLKQLHNNVWMLGSNPNLLSKFWSKAIDFLCFRKVRSGCAKAYFDALQQARLNPSKTEFIDYLIGIALGDAYGAGFENAEQSWIKENVHFDRYVHQPQETRAWSINYVLGDYTDDTEQTIANWKMLLNEPLSEITEQTMLRYWHKEWDSTLNWLGIGRKGHGSIRFYFYFGSKALEQSKRDQAKREFPGNAPVMRGTPFGFVKDEYEMVRLAVMNADATHPHPQARIASIITAYLTKYYLVEKRTPIGLLRYIIERIRPLINSQGPRSNPLADATAIPYLQELDTLPSFFTTNTFESEKVTIRVPLGPLLGRFQNWGLPCDALRTVAIACYFLKHTPLTKTRNFAGILLRETCLIGGDVDSLASLCVGLYGGRFGLGIEGKGQKNAEKEEVLVIGEEGLPVWVIDQMEGVGQLVELADQIQKKGF